MGIEEILLQYGLAGFVIWLIYKIIKNDFKHLTASIEHFGSKIDENTKAIYELKAEIEKLVVLLEKVNKNS